MTMMCFFLGPVVNDVLGVFSLPELPGKIIVPTRRSARVHVHTCCVTIRGIPWSHVRMLFLSLLQYIHAIVLSDSQSAAEWYVM